MEKALLRGGSPPFQSQPGVKTPEKAFLLPSKARVDLEWVSRI